MPCARLTAQSAHPKNDSAVVARQFVANANTILDSLTRLHFLRKEIATVKSELVSVRRSADQLRSELKAADVRYQQLTVKLTATETERDGQHKKARNRGWENWVWRGAATAYIYLKIRSL